MLLLLVVSNGIRRFDEAQSRPDPKDFQVLFSDVSDPAFREEAGITAVFSGDREIGAAASSDRTAPVVKGYGGELSLLAGVSPDGRLSAVRVWDHRESPAYLRAVLESGFLERFQGRDVGDDFSDIEAVTGATITSEAIRKGALRTARHVANGRYGRAVPSSEIDASFQADIVSLSLFLSAFAFAIVAFRRKTIGFRVASWLVSIVVFGIFLNVSVSFSQIAALLRLENPGGVQLEPILLLFLAPAFALFRKPVYCAQVCPFGAMQELLFRAIPGRLSPSPGLRRIFRGLRWGILAAAVLGAGVLAYEPAANFEPFGWLFSANTPFVLLLFALLVLAVSAFSRRFWCRLFCPTGACLELCARRPIGFGGKGDRTARDEGEEERP